MWEQYQVVIAELDKGIAAQLRAMAKQLTLPPLLPKPRACVAASHTIHDSTCARPSTTWSALI